MKGGAKIADNFRNEITVKGYKYIDKDMYQYTSNFHSLDEFFNSLKDRFKGKKIAVKQDDSIFLISDDETDEIVLVEDDNKVFLSNGEYTNGKKFKAIVADSLLKQLG